MTLPQRVAHTSFWLSHGTFWFTLLLGMLLGTSDVCIPYLTGCISITATGIPDPQAFVFRGGLISACVLFIVWWYCMQAWLTEIAPERPIWTVKYMVSAGIISSVCLIIATAVLRPDKANLPWTVHTVGAALFFLISLAVQTRITYWLRHLARRGVDIGSSLTMKFVLVYAQWFFLLLMIVLQLVESDDRWKNIVEWWMALLIGLFYLSSARDWHSFRLTDTD